MGQHGRQWKNVTSLTFEKFSSALSLYLLFRGKIDGFFYFTLTLSFFVLRNITRTRSLTERSTHS